MRWGSMRGRIKPSVVRRIAMPRGIRCCCPRCSGAVTLAAVSCSFFAAFDQPAPLIFSFFSAAVIGTLASGIYLFGILPNAHDFPMLIIYFAVPFMH